MCVTGGRNKQSPTIICEVGVFFFPPEKNGLDGCGGGNVCQNGDVCLPNFESMHGAVLDLSQCFSWPGIHLQFIQMHDCRKEYF